MLLIPNPANTQSAIESLGELVVRSKIRGMPATMAGIAEWYRLSSRRSELKETRTIAIKPARYGSITRMPTTVFE